MLKAANKNITPSTRALPSVCNFSKLWRASVSIIEIDDPPP
jgi:hypothetical protein